jgi:5-(carboxyamino)imidazole ribonucleotide mutase
VKVLVIFGSKSDANIYEPLKSRLLQDGHDLDFRMISVHRSPELLDRELQGLEADAVVAGAGLAAHLPGILASKLLVPVIGVPCSAALGGLDAFLSMAQMPFGIPVMAAGPDQYQTAVSALARASRLDLRFSFDRFFVVLERHKRNLPQFKLVVERAEKLAQRTNLPLEFIDRPKENSLNICLVDILEADPLAPLPFAPPQAQSDEIRIHVPLLTEESYRSISGALAMAKRVESLSGALWVGANNVGNAMLAALQLANSNGAYSAFLTNAKKGYIHA